MLGGYGLPAPLPGDLTRRARETHRQKRSPLYEHNGLLLVLILLRVLDGAALADDVDLDLAGIIEGILDLLGDLAGQQDDLIIADDIGLDHDADFAAGLNGKGLLHALKAGRDLLQIFQTLDIALHVLAAGTGTCGADGIAGLNDKGQRGTREMLSDFLMTQWAAQVLPISLREQWILKRNGIQTINLLVFGNAQKKFMTGIQKSMKIQDLNQCPLALLQKMEI